MIAELEGQIEPLAEQSEKAKRTKSCREQLKANEIALYVHQIEKCMPIGKKLGRSWKLQQETIALSTVVSQHDASLEKYRLEIRQLEEQLEKEQQALLEISGEAEKCDGQGEVLKERKRNLEISRKQTADQLQLLSERIQAKEAEQSGIVSRLQEVESQLAEAAKACCGKKKRV